MTVKLFLSVSQISIVFNVFYQVHDQLAPPRCRQRKLYHWQKRTQPKGRPIDKIFYADWTLLQKFSISGGNYETMRRRGSYLGIAVYFCPPHKSCTEIFADSWNVHPLSSEKNRSSEQLWILWRNIQKRELCTYEVIFILIPHVKRFHTVFRFLVST